MFSMFSRFVATLKGIKATDEDAKNALQLLFHFRENDVNKKPSQY